MRAATRIRARLRNVAAIVLALAVLSPLTAVRGTELHAPDALARHLSAGSTAKIARIAEDIQKMPIPSAAKAKALKMLASHHPLVGGTDPCDTAGVIGSLAGSPTVSSGQICVYQKAGCSWSVTSVSAGVSYAIDGDTLIVGAPSNLTQLSQGYNIDGAVCGFDPYDVAGAVLPLPERNCARCDRKEFGKPVDAADGEEFYSNLDVGFSGPFGLSFTRSYASLTQSTVGNTTAPVSDLGNNWRHNYTQRLDLSQSSSVAYYDETNLPYYFSTKPSTGSSAYDSISGMTLALSSDGSTWTLTAFDHRSWTFNANGLLTKLTDRIGNTQTVTRSTMTGQNNRIISVTDPLNRKLCFFYDSSNRITELSWLSAGSCPSSAPTSGTLVRMVYDSGTNCTTGQLCTVTEPDGNAWVYQYTSSNGVPNLLSEVDDPKGDPEQVTTYFGSVVLTQLSGHCAGAPPCPDTGSDLSFSYAGNASGSTTITDGQGGVTAVSYDPNTYLLLEVSGPQCKCGGDQTRIYEYDGYERTLTESDDGVNGSPKHTFTYSYGRDSGGNAYPGPTKVVENLDSFGTTRTTSYQYYAIGDPRQDLPQKTTLPSVDTSGTMTIMDTYQTSGTLTERSIQGYVNTVPTTYNWNWTYDSRGRMLTSVGPRTDVNQTTTYRYFADTDSDGNRAGQLSTVTDPLGHVTTYSGYSGFTSYTPFGSPQSMTDPNAVTTEYSYDARGRMLTSTLLGVTGDPANLATKWGYDAAGRLINVQWPAGNALAIGYDTSDRVTSEIRVDAGGLQHEKLALGYNTIDQTTSVAAQGCATPAVSCAAWNTTWSGVYVYTPATSNLAQITNPDGTYKSFSYIDSGALGKYNDENHETGTNYTYGYDVAGRRLSETRKLGSGSVVASYAYDLHDNVKSVTDENGNVTTYHYDDFDRVTTEVSPVQGTTTYTYDPDSNLLTTTDSNTATTTSTFDALDRRLTESAAVPSATPMQSSWTYDDATSGHFGIGHLASMTDPSGSTTYTYERRGSVAIQNQQVVSPPNFTQAYTYDQNENLATVTYPDGYVVTTTYDFADRPYSSTHSSTMDAQQLRALSERGVPVRYHASVPETPMEAGVSPSRIAPPGHVRRLFAGQTVSAGASITRAGESSRIAPPGVVGPHRAGESDNFVTSATYEPFGPINVIAFGNGTTQTLSWTDRYFPMGNKLVAPGTLANFSYSQDAVGNITSIIDNLNAGYSRGPGTTPFKYDDLNRLVTAPSGANLWGSNGSFSYDAMGNLKSLTLGGARTEAFSYMPGTGGSVGLPKISSVAESYGVPMTRTVTYDNFGNETSDKGAQVGSSYVYSARELLAKDTTFANSVYYYDGFRQRRATSTGLIGSTLTIDYFFDQSTHQLAETSLSAAPVVASKYVWFGDRPVAQVDSTGTHWTFADHLGTPIIQSDTNADVTWQAEYEPYGRLWGLRMGNNQHQPLRFPGQTAEQLGFLNNLTGRNYNNARWYRASWGRYTQADPLGIDESQSSLFAYSSDQPMTRFDSSGLQTEVGCATFSEVPIAAAICVAAMEAAKAAAVKATIRAGAAAAAAGVAASTSGSTCKGKRCRPCSPPVGTLMHRGPDLTGKRPHFNKSNVVREYPGFAFPSGPIGFPHYNYYEVGQIPYPVCKCVFTNIGLAAPSPPLPGTVPLQVPVGGGPAI